MWIKGFVHTDEENAIFVDVHVVENIDRYAGNFIGTMFLNNGETVLIKKHPGGTYNGQITNGEIIFNH